LNVGLTAIPRYSGVIGTITFDVHQSPQEKESTIITTGTAKIQDMNGQHEQQAAQKRLHSNRLRQVSLINRAKSLNKVLILEKVSFVMLQYYSLNKN